MTGEDAPLRLGFVGVGWMGRSRLERGLKEGVVEDSVILDPSDDAVAETREVAPRAERAEDLDDLLARDLDGVVVSTPNAHHEKPSRAALEAGLPVFCQKPLAPTSGGAERIVDAAGNADVPLGVDMSYRWTQGMQAVRDLVQAGELGDVYRVDAAFHNAYGPDKEWAWDPDVAGGGCLLDLGVHLADLVLWIRDHPPVEDAHGVLYRDGERLDPDPGTVEDHATAHLHLDDGSTAHLACSWERHLGRDCLIDVTVHGTRGGARFRNVDGSFFDFTAHRYDGTAGTVLAEPPDDWEGRGLLRWAERVQRGDSHDADAARGHVQVARVLDEVMGR